MDYKCIIIEVKICTQSKQRRPRGSSQNSQTRQKPESSSLTTCLQLRQGETANNTVPNNTEFQKRSFGFVVNLLW